MRRARTTGSSRACEMRAGRHRPARHRGTRRQRRATRSRSPSASWPHSSTAALAFRLRNLIGFQPGSLPSSATARRSTTCMRAVAEATKATGHVPTHAEIDEILDTSFFLPSANKPAHRQLKDAARRLVTAYTARARGRPAPGLGDRAPLRAAPRRRHRHRPRRRDPRRGRRRARPRWPSSTTRPRPAGASATTTSSSRSTPTPAGARASTCAAPTSTTSRPADARRRYRRQSPRRSLQPRRPSLKRRCASVLASTAPNPGPRCRRCEVRTICTHARPAKARVRPRRPS